MPTDVQSSERQPLFRRPLSKESIGTLSFVVVLTILTGVWCVFDKWNHDMSSSLFGMNELKRTLFYRDGQVVEDIGPFKYTLTLAFMQFAFMAVLFLSLFFVSAAWSDQDKMSRLELFDGRWPALVITHVFSSVLMQSLMMPKQMMSLGVFAASRAVEIPWAAAVRARVLNTRFGGHPLLTTGLMFTAAWMLFYAYTQISDCLCVWSGFGVALTGPSLYFVYALLLTIPATNTVVQEATMVQLKASPLLMLGLQNLGACLLFLPVLLLAHQFGYEDVQHAAEMITGTRKIFMTVVWLCVQTAVLSVVGVALVCTSDSFWAVAMRSMRVVYWWGGQLITFYLVNGGTLLSIAEPHASLWSFVMLVGLVLAFLAMASDENVQGLHRDSMSKGISERQGLLSKHAV